MISMTLDVQARLKELSLLNDGWLDGEGLALPVHGLQWFAESWTLYWPLNFERPYIYPVLQNNISLEWNIKNAVLDVEIDLANKTANILMSTGMSNGSPLEILIDSKLDISASDGWQKFIKIVGPNIN